MPVVAVDFSQPDFHCAREMQRVCRTARDMICDGCEPLARPRYQIRGKRQKQPKSLRLVFCKLAPYVCRLQGGKLSFANVTFDAGPKLQTAVQGTDSLRMLLGKREHRAAAWFRKIALNDVRAVEVAHRAARSSEM